LSSPGEWVQKIDFRYQFLQGTTFPKIRCFLGQPCPMAESGTEKIRLQKFWRAIHAPEPLLKETEGYAV
jgi:hypothetical protein